MDADARFRALYAAFNGRDSEAVLSQMTPDVEWPNAWEGGWLRGKDAVREYWTRQWQEIDPQVEPVEITRRDDDRVVVAVHQVVRSPDGELVGEGDVRHVYTVRDGLIARMDVEGC